MDDKQPENYPSQNEDIVDAEFEEITLSVPSQMETSLAIASVSTLSKQAESRFGCAYCFRTLNPEDIDETFRSSVRVDNRYFHRKCWEQFGEKGQNAEIFQPPLPEPLAVVSLVGSPLYAGPRNTIDDIPLGISEGTVVLDSSQLISLRIRNNSDNFVTLDRRAMPLWAYVKFDTQSQIQTHELTLMPGKLLHVQIYPHRVRPTLNSYYLSLSDRQGFNIDSRSPWLVQLSMLIGLYGLYFWHILSLLNLRFWLYYWGSYSSVQFHLVLAPFMTLTFLFGVILLLSPVSVLWKLYSFVQLVKTFRLANAISPLLSHIETLLLKLINSEFLERTQNHWVIPYSFLLISIGGLGAGLFSLLLMIVTLILKPLADIFFFAEAGFILYLLYRFGQGYGFNLVKFIEAALRLGISAYRTTQRQLGGM